MKIQYKAHHLVLTILIPFLMGTSAALLLLSQFSSQSGSALLSSQMLGIKTVIPNTPPAPSDETIQMALALFDIKVPKNVVGPSFDVYLADRGLTTGDVFGTQRMVKIGPAAFASWALLGSTLAHEIEVHVQQSFFRIVATEQLAQLELNARGSIGSSWKWWEPAPSRKFWSRLGTRGAEREAYEHELKNAQRFGLSKTEKVAIKNIMNRYYPQDRSDEVAQTKL